MKTFLSIVTVFLTILFSYQSNAQKLPFQGRLLENGAPVNDTLNFNFAIDSVSWAESHENVIVTEGLYSVILGSITPLPDDLFDNDSEHQLSITVGSTALSPVTIYAALGKNKVGTAQLRTIITGSENSADTAVYYEIKGGADTLSYTGVLASANSEGVNVGVRGNATSTTSNANYQVGTWGRAAGDGAAYHYGVIGQAAGKGQRNMGTYGIASGTGNGNTGLDSGSYNMGVFGAGSNNTWGNIGVYGESTGSEGVDNIGVVGWSFAGDENTENKGVLGWAKGTGINRGVHGIATGGVENWAGWFEGNVGFADSIGVRRVEVTSNGGRIIGRGANSKPIWNVFGVGNGGNYGSLHLYDSSGTSKIWGQVTPMPDGSGSGLFTLLGPKQGAIQGGFKSWETDSLINLPWLTFEGNIPNKSLIWMEAGKDIEMGHEFGSARFETTEDGRSVFINPSEIIWNGPNHSTVQIGAKGWESPDMGFISLKGENWFDLVMIETSLNDGQFSYGQAHFNTTQDNSRVNIASTGYFMHGPDRQAMGLGFQDWGDSNLAYLHMYDSSNNPIITLEPRQNGNVLEGALDLASQAGNYVNITSNGFTMNGPNSQIARIGNFAGEPYGGEDRSFLWLFGSDQATGGYSKVNLEVKNDGQGGDYGTINLSNYLANSTDQGTSTIFLNGKDGSSRFDGMMTVQGYSVQSDIRYKEDIRSLHGSLNKVNQLRGVSYNLKKNPEAGRQIGLIAQEIEEVYPEFVNTNDDGYKSVNYAQVTAVLIEAIKELNAKVASLEKENEELSSTNEELKAQLKGEMDALKNKMQHLEEVILGSRAMTTNEEATSGGK